MVAQSHQWDWLQMHTKIKCRKLDYLWGWNANMVLGTTGTALSYCENLFRILKEEDAAAPCHTVHCKLTDLVQHYYVSSENYEVASLASATGVTMEKDEDT